MEELYQLSARYTTTSTNFYVSRVRAVQGRKPQKGRDFFWKINTWNFKIYILVSGNSTITLYILTYTKKCASSVIDSFL